MEIITGQRRINHEAKDDNEAQCVRNETGRKRIYGIEDWMVKWTERRMRMTRGEEKNKEPEAQGKGERGRNSRVGEWGCDRNVFIEVHQDQNVDIIAESKTAHAEHSRYMQMEVKQEQSVVLNRLTLFPRLKDDINQSPARACALWPRTTDIPLPLQSIQSQKERAYDRA